MDVSADLTALSRIPVTVVSSGVKSILDIQKTLEVLETLGVPVCGYRTKEFPGFFTNITGCPSPMVVDSALEAALTMLHSRRLGLRNGMLVAVPNPAPATGSAEGGGLDDAAMARVIEDAVASAAARGVEGAAITPFLLGRVAELTGGRSVDSNVALVYNNAQVATEIAVEYAKLLRSDELQLGGGKGSFSSYGSVSRSPASGAPAEVLVVGGMVIDHVVRPSPARGRTAAQPLIMGTSNPGTASQSFGGVGRNVAEAVAASAGGAVAVQMVSAVGDDAAGTSLLQHCAELGIDVSNVRRVGGGRTATYTAVHDHVGDLVVAVADMDALRDIPVAPLGAAAGAARPIVVADGNLSAETFRALADRCQYSARCLFFEPTSVPKCTVPVLAGCMDKVRARIGVTSFSFILTLTCLALVLTGGHH